MICRTCGTMDEGRICSQCGAPLEGVTILVGAEDTDLPARTKVPAALCPVCVEGVLELRPVGTDPGSGPAVEFVCRRCGSRLIDHTGDRASLELVETGEPSLLNWRLHAHRSLSIPQWKAIAQEALDSQQEAERSQDKAEVRPEAPEDLTPAAPLFSRPVVPMPEIDCPVLMRAGEQGVFALYGISLHEPKSVSTGGYGGARMRVGLFSVGGGRFESQSHDELRKVDEGAFVLTNQRLVFVGGLQSVDIPLPKMSGVEGDRDSVVVYRRGKQKVLVFGNLSTCSLSFTVAGRSHDGPLTGSVVKETIEALFKHTS